MKVSIVMAYYNRYKLLMHTLKSIEHYNIDRDIEVIIIDDNSVPAESLKGIQKKFKIKIFVIEITKEEKKWSCCCVPYNIGFSFVSGDLVIIQNPENIHNGDIIGHALKNIKDNTYLAYGCYSLDSEGTQKLHKVMLSENFDQEAIKKSISPLVGLKKEWKDGQTCWYNHSKYNAGCHHFCTAIMKSDLESLSGFDERYSRGFAFDDVEFVARIKKKGMNICMVDDPFVIHQFHKVSDYKGNNEGFERNRIIYSDYTLKESFYKAPVNNFYHPGVTMKDEIKSKAIWHLAKIPKILHVYFGGVKMSYLRYLTIISFMRLNPDWQVRFYYPRFPVRNHSWKSSEQKYTDNWEDYTPKLRRLKISMVEVDYNFFGLPNTMSEVHKSDILRWHLLSIVGGLWCDMDILYFRPITNLSINIKSNKNADTIVCISGYGHSVGFMMGAAGNEYFRILLANALKRWNGDNYQCITAPMCNDLFPTVDSIRLKTSCNPVNLGMEAVYLHNADQISEIFGSPPCPRENLNTIGIHWYAGSQMAGEFMSRTNGGLDRHSSTIGRLIYEEKIANEKAGSTGY